MRRRRPVVAIIGGGFAGAAVAYHLHRLSPGAFRIVIFEPRPEIGRGLAYSSADPAHRINVPASRMSLLPEDPAQFDRWVRSSGRLLSDPDAFSADGHVYPVRLLFGDYVVAQMRSIAHALKHHPERAVRVTKVTSRYLVESQSASMEADVIVLGLCHPAPGHPVDLPSDVVGHHRFIGDPSVSRAIEAIHADASVLIVGTGLTMADIVASLDRGGHRGRIVAISRRGQRSLPHGNLSDEPFGDFIAEPIRSASELVARIRQTVRRANAEGLSWHPVLDQVRLQGSAVWRNLQPGERRRLLRHLRPFWDTHRFRIAPQVASVLDRRIGAGTLVIRAASLSSITKGRRFRVTMRRRGTGESETELFDAIVLATGPAHRSVVASDPMLREMTQAGLIAPDQYGLGIEVDDDGRVASAGGEAIFVAGALARGTFGELIAVPDLVKHALRLAAAIRHPVEQAVRPSVRAAYP